MNSLSKQDDPIFTRAVMIGVAMALLTAMVIATVVVLIVMVAFYGRKYGV